MILHFLTEENLFHWCFPDLNSALIALCNTRSFAGLSVVYDSCLCNRTKITTASQPASSLEASMGCLCIRFPTALKREADPDSLEMRICHEGSFFCLLAFLEHVLLRVWGESVWKS